MSISRRESPPEPVVGSYRVDNEIGKGSFATVYRAHSQVRSEKGALRHDLLLTYLGWARDGGHQGHSQVATDKEITGQLGERD